MVFYESVHRIEKTLRELEEYLSADAPIVIGREITKKFEEFVRGSVADAREYFAKNPEKKKGEFVVVV